MQAWAPLAVIRLARRTAFGQQVPEALAAHGVCDQMDALGAALVEHPVPAPRIEDPAFARGHVDLGIPALEAHARRGDDGDVHAHALAPVVIDVDVRLHLRLAVEAHEARAPPRSPDCLEHLAQIGATVQPGCGPHAAGKRIAGGVALRRDQRQRAVAVVPRRPPPPCALLDRGHLGQQGGGIERDGKLDERDLQFHGRVSGIEAA